MDGGYQTPFISHMLIIHSRKFIVYVITKTRRVDNGECNTNTILFKFCNGICILSGTILNENQR